ncbi:MAG: glycosyltransferase family 2 protein [Thiotrichales bacterium]
MHRLLIVSVNYRTADLAIECMASVYRQRDDLPDARMVVVDNDSQDGSLEKIALAIEENGWSDMIEVVDAGKNGGFSYGNNFAIRPAMASDEPPDFVWLLNPDAHLKEGAGSALIDFFDQHPRAGFATSACVDPSGELQTMAFRKFTPMSEFVGTMKLGVLEKLFPKSVIALQPKPEPFQADWLSGSSLMIRKAVFDELGLMDEDYFLYFEESDFCLQAQRKGWELWYVPDSKIFHVIGASTGVTEGSAKKDAKSKRRPAYWFYSRRRYYIKNFGKINAIAADVMHLLGFSLWTARRIAQRKPNLDPPNYLSDFFKNSVFVKGFDL